MENIDVHNPINEFLKQLFILTFKLNFSDSESFTCYKCGKIFAYESYLERHVKYVCPDKTGRTWKCSYCVKAFQYPCYLRRHMRSHTGKNVNEVHDYILCLGVTFIHCFIFT